MFLFLFSSYLNFNFFYSSLFFLMCFVLFHPILPLF